MFRTLTLPLLAVTLAVTANAQLDKILSGIGKSSNQSDSKTSSGLKEALQIGTEHAVDLTGTADGFFRNKAIKILMPEKLRMAEKGLRMGGFGGKIDEFELNMNRAAENTAPAARGVFKDALIQMTFDDARKILSGGNTPATEYFKSKTSSKPYHCFQANRRVRNGSDRRCTTVQAFVGQHSDTAIWTPAKFRHHRLRGRKDSRRIVSHVGRGREKDSNQSSGPDHSTDERSFRRQALGQFQGSDAAGNRWRPTVSTLTFRFGSAR